MMGKWQRIKRPLVRLLITIVLGWLLLWSLLVTTAWWVLPRVEWRADTVGKWLSERTRMTLQVQAVDARWTRRGPVFRLHGLALGDQGEIQIGSAQWVFAIYDGLMPGHSLSELHISGLDLDLQQQADGRWSVSGLQAQNGSGDPLDALARLGEVQLNSSRLHVRSLNLGIDRVVPRVDLRMRVDGERLRMGMRGWVHADESPIRGTFDVNRETGTGRLWLSTDALALANWPALWKIDGARLSGGKAGVSVWMSMRGWTPERVSVSAKSEQVQLIAADGQDVVIGKTMVLAQWQRREAGWQIHIPRLQLDGHDMDDIQVRWDGQWQVDAPRIALGPALQMLRLSERAPSAFKAWLLAAEPEALLQDVRWNGDLNGQWRGTARLEDVRFKPVGNAPGVTGLSGHVLADGQGLSLQLDPSRDSVLDWPGGFGKPHRLFLNGSVAAWPDAQGWRVGLDGLHVKGTDYGASIRGGMLFPRAGGRPYLDLAAALDDAPMTAAKRFWIRSKMSPDAIAWLDAALVSGHVRGGQALVSGDLDDWPFSDKNGRFEARARIDQGTVHFADGWKDMTAVDADVTFIADGFELEGQGRLGGIDVKHFTSGIPHFGAPLLTVRAKGTGEAAGLLGLLRDSPLYGSNRETLDALAARGPAEVEFQLEQGLGARTFSKVSGGVALNGVALSDRRWGIGFDQVRGTARYDNHGFSAPALRARLDGEAATLALRAGSPHTTKAHNIFEAELNVAQHMSDLLRRAPDLAWVGNFMKGRSEWNIAVEVPNDAGVSGKPMAVLGLRSELAGTALRLPAPLEKDSESRLPTRIRVPLPIGTQPVEMSFGQRLALWVEERAGKTAVLATLGSSQVQGAVPLQGLKVNGHTEQLDALSWVALARQPSAATTASASQQSNGLMLREIDLMADRLILAGGRFDDTRLRLVPGNARINVQLDGAAVKGQLVVPDAEGTTVVGKFRHLHWRRQSGTPVLDERNEVAADLDPSTIPPLALDVERLQVDNLDLGSALLRSRPLSDGVQVDVLQVRKPGQVIDIQGSWRGLEKSARTHVKVQLDSQDVGALSRMLDQQGHLHGGQGSLLLDATWDGAPQAFALANLEGALKVNVRNGQLLEVDPGAGRVLGLLSVTQLPRRMVLDFRDLFSKGLAYNQIKADIAFENGRAQTRTFAIDSSAAQIQISGHTDLAGQRFNQLVEVNPRSGNLLAVVGAVAGGPVGAAVGAAANAVLAKPLSEIGARVYKVSGPWKQPQVEVIDRQPMTMSDGLHGKPAAKKSDTPAVRTGTPE